MVGQTFLSVRPRQDVSATEERLNWAQTNKARG